MNLSPNQIRAFEEKYIEDIIRTMMDDHYYFSSGPQESGDRYIMQSVKEVMEHLFATPADKMPPACLMGLEVYTEDDEHANSYNREADLDFILNSPTLDLIPFFPIEYGDYINQPLNNLTFIAETLELGDGL